MKKYLLLVLFLCLASINSPSFAKDNCNDCIKTNELTVGVVQKNIHTGMSQDEVSIAIGSPNIVTKDSNGKETWIYDKIATEIKQKSGGGYFWLVIFGIERSHENITTNQKTLTVIIKFNEKNLVDTVTYHSSKF